MKYMEILKTDVIYENEKRNGTGGTVVRFMLCGDIMERSWRRPIRHHSAEKIPVCFMKIMSFPVS